MGAFSDKYSTPYGPGAAKSPVSGEGVVPSKFMKFKVALNVIDVATKAVTTEVAVVPASSLTIADLADLQSDIIKSYFSKLSNVTIYGSSECACSLCVSQSPPSSAEYLKFADSYGLTINETRAFVCANDSGATFEELAIVLAEAPIPHTREITPQRQADETLLVDRLYDLARLASRRSILTFIGYA